MEPNPWVLKQSGDMLNILKEKYDCKFLSVNAHPDLEKNAVLLVCLQSVITLLNKYAHFSNEYKAAAIQLELDAIHMNESLDVDDICDGDNSKLLGPQH